MNISVTSTGDEDTAVYIYALLSTFLIKGNSEFQIEVSKNKDAIIPAQVVGHYELLFIGILGASGPQTEKICLKHP